MIQCHRTDDIESLLKVKKWYFTLITGVTFRAVYVMTYIQLDIHNQSVIKTESIDFYA